MPNPLAATITTRDPASSGRSFTPQSYGAADAAGGRRSDRRGLRVATRSPGRNPIVLGGSRRLLTSPAQDDRREWQADVAERLDRDEESGEEEEDREELADLEDARHAEAIEGVAAACEEPADRDED